MPIARQVNWRISMKTTLFVGATLLALGASAAKVVALDSIALQGSDTLEQVTKDVLAACPAATGAGISYNGGGSTTGENAMIAGTQTVAPMSRFLNTNASICPKGSTAEGLVIGLDGIAIAASSTNAGACGGGLAYTTGHSFAVTDTAGNAVVNCSGCDVGTNTYRLTDWKDVLKLVYGGATHAGATDCASDVRRSLVSNWGNIFEGSCTAGTCPAGLKHAFRRADGSGTTDTLAAALGLPGLPSSKAVSLAAVPPLAAKAIPYCNAFGLGAIYNGDSDYQDKDPIRRTCDTNEQACSKDNTLGLVVVVEVPADMSVAQAYPTTACSVGKFKLMKPAAGVTTCPDGGGLLIGKCFHPYIDLGGGAYNPHCIAAKSPVQGIRANGMTGRAYNLVAKLNQTFVDNVSVVYAKDNLNRPITGAFYRVHTTAVLPGGGATCQQSSSTDQMGCLVSASPCSIGYAGREADQQPGAIALTVNNIADTQANIEKLVTSPGDPTTYPISRKLFFNTMNGFETVTGGELELAKCMGKNSLINPIISARGFIPVPGGVTCQDFVESGCAGVGTTIDSCSNNPAGLISP
jgi:hypothetical protein